MTIEIKRPPLTKILLWIAGAVTLVLTRYGIFSGVVLALPFPCNYLMVINSFMVGSPRDLCRNPNITLL